MSSSNLVHPPVFVVPADLDRPDLVKKFAPLIECGLEPGDGVTWQDNAWYLIRQVPLTPGASRALRMLQRHAGLAYIGRMPRPR